jgi:hypothetical protein
LPVDVKWFEIVSINWRRTNGRLTTPSSRKRLEPEFDRTFVFDSSIRYFMEAFAYYHFMNEILAVPEFQKTFGESIAPRSLRLLIQSWARDPW